MPSKSAHVKNEKLYGLFNDKGTTKQRAARVAPTTDAREKGGSKDGTAAAPEERK